MSKGGAMYVPGKAGFKQPANGMGKQSTSKNKSAVGFEQPSHGKGKQSSAKNKGAVGFSQPSHGAGSKSAKKNPGKAGFQQPNPAGKTVGTGISAKAATMPKMGKMSGQPKVSSPIKVPKGGFKSLDDLTSARKKHYGV